MSAAVPRPAARWRDAVRAEGVVLLSAFPLAWLALILLLSAGSPSAAMTQAYEDTLRVVFGMLLLPLAWQGEGARRRGAALPVGDAAREVVRVLCGAACAGSMLALGLALHAVRYTESIERFRERFGDPLPAPPTLFEGVMLWIVGITHYLVGAALALRAERPGRVLVTAMALELAAFGVAMRIPGLGKGIGALHPHPVTAALAIFAVGAGAVAVAIWLGGPDRALPRARNRRDRLAAAAASPPPHRPAGLRAPASAPRIFARQFMALAPSMGWVLLITGVYVALAVTAEKKGYGETIPYASTPFGPLWQLGLYWPVLVWMDERRAQPWDEAHPIGSVVRRLLHAVAGLAWLLIVAGMLAVHAVRDGLRYGLLPSSPAELPAWFWLGVPLGATAMYALGTAFIVPADRKVLTAVVFCGFIIPWALYSILDAVDPDAVFGPPGPYSPSRMLAALNWIAPEHWTVGAALLWTILPVAAAVAAIAWRARRERYGRSTRLRALIYALIQRVRPRRHAREAA